MKLHLSSKTADAALLIVAVIWGSTFVIVQNAVSFLQPLAFNGIRFMIAAFFLFVWLLLVDFQQLKKISLYGLIHGFFIGLCLFIGYGAQTIGLLYTSSSKAGFITGLSVVLVPLFLFLFFKQKLNMNMIVGVLLATVGLYFLSFVGAVELNIGDLYVFICAIGFALQIILTGKYSEQHPTLLLTIIQISTVSILSFIGSLLFEDVSSNFRIENIFQQDVIIALCITSILATALAFLIQTSLQKFTNATRVALIFSTEPVFAALTAFFFVQERLPISAWAGCFLILCGMVFSEIPQGKFRLVKNRY